MGMISIWKDSRPQRRSLPDGQSHLVKEKFMNCGSYMLLAYLEKDNQGFDQCQGKASNVDFAVGSGA